MRNSDFFVTNAKFRRIKGEKQKEFGMRSLNCLVTNAMFRRIKGKAKMGDGGGTSLY